MSIPRELRYTKDHEWARTDDDGLITVGVTDYAQEQLGEIVYVELPTSGEELTQDEPFGVIESTKSVSDLFAPLTGTVEESNTNLINAKNPIKYRLTLFPSASGSGNKKYIITLQPESAESSENAQKARTYWGMLEMLKTLIVDQCSHCFQCFQHFQCFQCSQRLDVGKR